jgi:pimeloyl-ACP methyl ester carboxylesterase
MMYWLPASGASSARLYWESFAVLLEKHRQIPIPAGVSIFPREIFRASRRWCEERYPRLVHYNVLPKGGHFAAFEQPASFVGEVRASFRHAR